MEKEIHFKVYDGRYTHYLTAVVKKVLEHKGHEIYEDKDEWLYIECHGNWQYFGTMREAKKFINHTIW